MKGSKGGPDRSGLQRSNTGIHWSKNGQKWSNAGHTVEKTGVDQKARCRVGRKRRMLDKGNGQKPWQASDGFRPEHPGLDVGVKSNGPLLGEITLSNDMKRAVGCRPKTAGKGVEKRGSLARTALRAAGILVTGRSTGQRVEYWSFRRTTLRAAARQLAAERAGPDPSPFPPNPLHAVHRLSTKQKWRKN